MRCKAQQLGAISQSLWASAGTLIAILEVCVIIAAARHGFDFTDEGFDLNAISGESEGATHVSFFGPVYRPVAIALNGNVVALRWFNIGMVLLAAGVLGWALGSRDNAARGTVRSWGHLGVVSAAVSALGIFANGLLTPNYNALAATGILLVASGLALSWNRTRTSPVALLVGIGGVVAFLGKPPSGVATAVAATAVLITLGPQARRALLQAIAVAGGLLLALSWSLAGSPAGLVRHLQKSIEDARTLDAGHDIVSAVSSFGLPGMSAHDLIVASGVAVVAFSCALSMLTEGKSRVAFGLLAGGVAAGIAAALVSHMLPLAYFLPSHPVVLAAGPLALMGAALLSSVRRDRATWTVAVALCLLPHAWVFGSNNDYWRGASALYVLWFSGAVVLLWSQLNPRSTAVAAGIPMMLLTAAVIAASLANPYRQTVPTLAQDSPTPVGPTGTLLLAPDFAAAIESFRETAERAGFTPKTPIIDLSGQMPGLIYALDGAAAGAPWIIGGYPGSEAVAARTLTRTSCETLARSWLIDEPGGTRAIDPVVLVTSGFTIGDWTAVASEAITTVPGTTRHITLLAPSGSYAARLATCNAAR